MGNVFHQIEKTDFQAFDFLTLGPVVRKLIRLTLGSKQIFLMLISKFKNIVLINLYWIDWGFLFSSFKRKG